jgi:hypothetical protein
VEWQFGRLYTWLNSRLAGKWFVRLTRWLLARMSTRKGTLESTCYRAGTVLCAEEEMPLVQDEAAVLGFEEVAELG